MLNSPVSTGKLRIRTFPVDVRSQCPASGSRGGAGQAAASPVLALTATNPAKPSQHRGATPAKACLETPLLLNNSRIGASTEVETQ